VFNINYDIIVQLLLPVWLRQPKQIAFLKAVLKPLKQLYNTFVAYRLKTLSDISHTGQVMYIEHLLNGDAMSVDDIYLSDNIGSRLDDYIYNQAEGQVPVYVYNSGDPELVLWFVRNDQEYYFIDDFIVNIPNGVVVSEANIKNIVNKYKQAGKRYSINYLPPDPE